MKKIICSAMIVAALPLASIANTIFSDNFTSGSTVQSMSPITPTANATTYQYFQQGSNPTNPVIAAHDLRLIAKSANSSISEVQALFTTTPVTLATVGDYIELTIVFTNTKGIFPALGTNTLNIGLFNSGGVKPVQGVRLDSTGSGTGGAVGWIGYVGRIVSPNGPTASIYTRPAQGLGITNPNQSQDALFNGASSSSTYNNPQGATIATTTTQFAAGLNVGSTYTLDFQIALTATGTLTISNAIYSGNAVNPANLLFSTIHKATDTNVVTSSLDALALGWRYNYSTQASSSIDISQITVTASIASSGISPFNITSIQVPAPGSAIITWDSVDGQSYQVQSTDALNPVNWKTNATVSGTGSSTSYTDTPISLSVTQRYYRVGATTP